jgi:hypothetical protein
MATEAGVARGASVGLPRRRRAPAHVRFCFAKRNETLAEVLKRLRTWAVPATT